MKDRIIASYQKDFSDRFGLTDLDEGTGFEYLANYCAISRHYADSFEPEEVAVGGTGDLGLDGVGILVNDHLVFSTETVDYLKRSLRRLDVEFIFVQAKSSPHFEAAEIGTFFSGVRQFFDDSDTPHANDQIRELRRIKDHIFASSIHMDHSPVCRLYYVSAGTWMGEPALLARIDQGTKDLKNTGLFASVEFTPIDSESLKRLYRELNHKIVREIVFDKHTILPSIGGVQEAYIGIVPCLEYLKLISNEDGSLNRRLFYDNVRDFQGHNPVNTEIEGTVQDNERRDRFALLNNGVTIVARDVNKVGATFRLKDYQIVNGCQTSHILHLNRTRLTSHVYLPVKLIVTTDSEVTNQVIQGTNRQTEVKLEAFESLAPFQKKLEELYLALGRDRTEPLYYERRSKQYDHLEIRRERIVTLAAQIKCFVAMFLDEPHSTHRYYGELLSSYRNRVFSESHSAMPYYMAGAALARVEHFFMEGRLPRTWRPYKYQLLMVYRLQNEPFDLPPLNSKAIDKYCDKLLEQLENRASSESAFHMAGQFVDSARVELGPWREPPERTKAFTAALTDRVSGAQSKRVATTERTVGAVKWFSEILGYGFITADDGREVFVHYSGISGSGYRNLVQAQRVQFAVVEKARGPAAVDVEAI